MINLKSIILIISTFFYYTYSVANVNSEDITSKKISILLDSSLNLRNVSLVESITICQQAVNIAETENNPQILSKLYKTQGINYYFLGNNDSAFVYYDKAISQFEAIDSKVDIGKVLGNIGLLYKRQAKYDKALEYYIQNLTIYEEAKYDKGKGSVLNNIANLYHEQTELKQAEEFYLLALKNFKKHKNIKELANAYCNLGVINEKRKNYQLSLDYYDKSLQENSKLNDELFKSKLLFNIGYVHHAQGKLDIALQEVKKSEEIRSRIGDLNGNISCKIELGRILASQNNFKSAEKYIKEAESIAIANNMSHWQAEILLYLTENYQQQNKYEEAFKTQSLMIQLNDSIKDAEVEQRFNEINAKFLSEQKEKEFELLQQKTQIQNLELGQKNAWIIILLVVMILGIVAVLVSLRINRLRADHKIMDLRQKVLLTQMNPHFLFNSLTAIQSFILDDKNDKANSYLARLASLVRGILENSREEFVSLKTELNTLEDYIGLQKLRFENDIAYQFDVDQNLDQNLIMVPPMLAQPFVENALIHGRLRTNPKALINISISQSSDKEILKFCITDNGIGIDEAKKQTFKKNHKSLATSIALDRVKIYNFKSSKKMNFEITDLKHIDSNLHGTQVTFSIPQSIKS